MKERWFHSTRGARKLDINLAANWGQRRRCAFMTICAPHVVTCWTCCASRVRAPPPLLHTSYIADELHRYDNHMRDARGLISATRGGRLGTKQRLLLHKFAVRPVLITELQPNDVR